MADPVSHPDVVEMAAASVNITAASLANPDVVEQTAASLVDTDVGEHTAASLDVGEHTAASLGVVEQTAASLVEPTSDMMVIGLLNYNADGLVTLHLLDSAVNVGDLQGECEVGGEFLPAEPVEQGVTSAETNVESIVATSSNVVSLINSETAEQKQSVGKDSRKRCRRENSWKRNLRRNARTHGQPYTSVTGQRIEGKQALLEGCLCGPKCRLKCSTRFCTEDRNDVFSNFYSLSSDSQNVYLRSCFRASKPQVAMANAQKHRSVSFKYFITISGQERQVCKKALQALLQVGKGKLDYMGSRLCQGNADVPSQQGKHSNRPTKTSEVQVDQVIEHIQMFPSESSHYSRNQNPNRKYLSSLLTVNKMYDEYKIWCTSKNYIAVSVGMYRKIFTTRFNLGFGSPRTDTCSKCDSQSGDDTHKQLAETAFKTMAEDRRRAKENADCHYITFDLQKTLPLPKLSTSIAFYLRQIWLYNLGVHYISGSKECPYFQIWTENEGLRGCNEIGSALLVFLDVADVRGGSLVAWSDSCAGQNKNFYILSLWQYLIYTGRFSQIEHKFPIPGHSFLDSDRDFAHVETEVRKHQNIYAVDTYRDIMVTSMRSTQPHVTDMKCRFVNVKGLPKSLHLINRSVTTDSGRVAFRDGVRWILVDKYGQYKYRESFSENEPWKMVDLLPSRSNASVNVDVELEQLPSGNIPIKPCKLKDIEKQKPFIPPLLRSFYDSLACKAQDRRQDVADKSGSESDMEIEPTEEGQESSELRNTELRHHCDPATKTREKEPKLCPPRPRRGAATKASEKEPELCPSRRVPATKPREKEPELRLRLRSLRGSSAKSRQKEPLRRCRDRKCDDTEVPSKYQKLN